MRNLQDTINRYGLDAKKSLGQHFLLDEGITEQIVRYAGDLNGINAIEIGPGPGGLTRSLLRSKAKHVYVVEKDDRAIAIMQELAEAFPGRLTILHEDALSVNLLEQVPPPRRVIANLPYNIGTQLLLNWLEQIYATPGSNFESLTLMFQKEVAERITAAPGSKAYGSLSVFAQWLCEARWDMDLPPEAFSPPPKVHSAVITLTPREKPLVEAPKEALEKVLAAAFNQRRKMLRVSLKSLDCDINELFRLCDIASTDRVEQVGVNKLCEMALHYEKLKSRRPSDN